MKARAAFLCLALFLAPSVLAQHPPHPLHPPGPDPIGEALFPPELVMRHQQALGLTAEQKTSLRKEMSAAQQRFTELQWQLQDAVEALASILNQEQVTESQALAQLEKVLDTERQIKQTQITLMVRIKNKLTPEQQARLRELRPKMPPVPPGPPSPPRPEL